jgi:pilus assembly protein Flp/PilA
MLRSTCKRFVDCESGATAIEYGLIAAIVGVGIVAGLIGFRDGFRNMIGFAVAQMPNG